MKRDRAEHQDENIAIAAFLPLSTGIEDAAPESFDDPAAPKPALADLIEALCFFETVAISAAESFSSSHTAAWLAPASQRKRLI